MTSVFAYRALFGVSVCLAACASDDGRGDPAERVYDPGAAETSTTADADVCDIMAPECQDRVLAMVAAERGKPLPPAPAYEFAALAPTDDQAIVLRDDAADERLTLQWDAAYAALQLLPPVLSLRRAEANQRDDQMNKAFYSFQRRAVVLTARSNVLGRDPRAEMGTLAHELTHYMQDLELGVVHLYDVAPDDIDAESSLRALIEGEATYVGWSIQSRLAGLTPTAADWSTYFDAVDTSYLARISHSTTPLATALDCMPYSIGGRYIATLWRTSGRAAVDELSAHIPLSFAEWMAHGAPAPTWPARDVACAAPAAPPDYELRGQTQLGALGALAFLAAGYAEDLDLVAPLRADSLRLYAPANARTSGEQVYSKEQLHVVAVWQLRFESEADARAYELAISPPTSGDRTYTRRKNLVALAVSTDPAQRAAAMLDMLDCQ